MYRKKVTSGKPRSIFKKWRTRKIVINLTDNNDCFTIVSKSPFIDVTISHSYNRVDPRKQDRREKSNVWCTS